jgi:hypothetical protein
MCAEAEMLLLFVSDIFVCNSRPLVNACGPHHLSAPEIENAENNVC